MKDSQNNIGKHGLVAEYNANNAWLYNGNNGRLNNNNKNNTNSVRPVLEFNRESKAEADMMNYVVPLQTWYDIYRQCRKRKGTKPSHLVFLFDFMQVVNSYNGLLKWCNAYRLRREVFERLKASPWRRVFYFHDDFHVTLQPHATPIGQFIRRNKQRKKGQSKWPR